MELIVNGKSRRATTPDRKLLVDYLRSDLRLTGTHIGCDDGRCGACTVHLDGRPAKSCMVLLAHAEGRDVETVESQGSPEDLSVLQASFKKMHGLQCGYCTPGMVMSAKALLERNPEPTEAEVREAIAGNICRCTGYNNIVDSVLDAAATLRGETYVPPEAPPEHAEADRSFGRNVPREHDKKLLTGLGRYSADNPPFGTLYCAVLRSPYAHARILSVDASEALAMEGVEYVLTGAEAKDTWANSIPVLNPRSVTITAAPALAVDKAIYQGEPIAAVAASDQYIAEDALAAIAVEYEVLPPITGIEQSLKGLVRLYDDWPDNIGMDRIFAEGDVEGAFAKAAHVVHHDFHHHRYTSAPMEARCTLANYDRGNGTIRIDMSTQMPFQCRTLFAEMLEMSETHVQVVAPDVGGGFGSKMGIYDDVLPVMLSIKTGRPVLWQETRAENFLSAPHARDYDARMSAAFDGDGRILALRGDWIGDSGCDGSNRAIGLGQISLAVSYATGNYKVPAFHGRGRGVMTNKAPYGAYRGFGKDIANQSIERLMDVAARQIGLEPNELRRRNLIQPDEFPYETITGAIFDSGDYPELLRMAETAMGHDDFKRRQAEALADGRYIGLGYAMLLEPAGGSIPNSRFTGAESATVRMTPEGGFLLLTGIQDIGQGITTAYSQVVADELRVDPGQVRVMCGNTDQGPYGLGAWSSRGAAFGVSSAMEAAKALSEKLRKIAAHILGCDPFDLDHRPGGGFGGPEGKSLSYRDIGQAVNFFPGAALTVPKGVTAHLEETATWQSDIARWVPRDNGSLSLYANHGSGCFAIEVEVDVETGRVVVSRVYVAHDCGRVVNPAIVNGQLHGGVVQGLGAILNEELRYDEQGNLLNTSFWTYMVPQAPDTPRIEVGHLESPSPFTPLGTKGMGEGGPVGVPAAVMNAVENALTPLGFEITETPLSPDRMVRMIGAARTREQKS